MNRITRREGNCTHIVGNANSGRAIIRLGDYEDTGLTPSEIMSLKAERDAAVKELERQMRIFGESCEICASKTCTVAPYYKCVPKWRGPQQEARDGIS